MDGVGVTALARGQSEEGGGSARQRQRRGGGVTKPLGISTKQNGTPSAIPSARNLKRSVDDHRTRDSLRKCKRQATRLHIQSCEPAQVRCDR